MEVISQSFEKVVRDYDITFAGGIVMSVTIDELAGDSREQVGPTIRFFIAERPSPLDPTGRIPAETTIVNLVNVLAIQERDRVVVEASAAQKEEWRQAFKELSGTQGN